MADGKITFSTKLDNSELQKQLRDTRKEIDKASAGKAKAEAAKLPLERSLDALKPKMEAAKKDLEEYRQRVQDARDTIASDASTAEDKEAAREALKEDLRNLHAQEKQVDKLQRQWNDTTRKVEGYNAEIARQDELIEAGKEKAGGIMQEISKANGPFRKAMEKTRDTMQGMEKAMMRMAKRVFVFQMITKVLRTAREYFGQMLSTNSEYTAQIAKLRGALATAFQPLYEAAVPVLTTILKLLTQIANVAAQAMSALFGKTVKQSAQNAAALNQQAQAIKGVGGAAEEAAAQLASFDEINRLEESTGGGGGSGTAMDFSDVEDANIMADKLNVILGIVGAIGAGLALWKLSDKLPGKLATVSKRLSGILFAVGGILLFTDGFKSANENGINLANTLEMVAGLITGGLGISLFTGRWAPLLISGISGCLFALVYFTGNGEELMNGLNNTFGGLFDAVEAFRNEDWDGVTAGVKRAFEGLGKVLKTMWDGVSDGFNALVTVDPETGESGLDKIGKAIEEGLEGFGWEINLDSLVGIVATAIGGLAWGPVGAALVAAVIAAANVEDWGPVGDAVAAAIAGIPWGTRLKGAVVLLSKIGDAIVGMTTAAIIGLAQADWDAIGTEISKGLESIDWDFSLTGLLSLLLVAVGGLIGGPVGAALAAIVAAFINDFIKTAEDDAYNVLMDAEGRAKAYNDLHPEEKEAISQAKNYVDKIAEYLNANAEDYSPFDFAEWLNAGLRNGDFNKTEIVDAFQKLGVKNIAEDLGIDIGLGVQEGIKAKSGAVTQETRTMVQKGIIDQARKILDSHSPSVVMEEIGEDAVDGLVLGLDTFTAKIAPFLDNFRAFVQEIIAETARARLAMSMLDEFTWGRNIPTSSGSGYFSLGRMGIPMLAQGAVIPPNAPFVAMLGDQNRGTNIEAPEDLIRKIVREESGGMNGEMLAEMVDLMGVLIQAVNGIGDDRIGRAASRYISRTSRARGV